MSDGLMWFWYYYATCWTWIYCCLSLIVRSLVSAANLFGSILYSQSQFNFHYNSILTFSSETFLKINYNLNSIKYSKIYINW